MSEIKVNSIVDASGGSTVQVNGFTPSASNMAGRNRIINGDMRIDQRNAGASVTPVDSTGTYTLDRWRAYESTDGSITVQQNSLAPAGFTNSLKVTVATPDASLAATQQSKIEQIVEGFNVADFVWGTANAKTVTLSFWVQSSLTGTFGGAFQNSIGTRSYPFTYTINSVDTWEYKTVTIQGDTTGTWLNTNDAGIRVAFAFGAGADRSGTAGAWNSNNNVSATGATNLMATSGATFYITGVQLEEGSVATPFCPAGGGSYGQELALCQRYFYKEENSTYHVALLDGSAGDYPEAWVTHPVQMRAAPTATFENIASFYYNTGSGSTSFTPSGGTTSYAGNTRIGYAIRNAISNSPGTTHNQKAGQWYVQLSFSAEL